MALPAHAFRPAEPAPKPAPEPFAEPFAEPFGAVLLDMDGTLIDSIASVERSWARWCDEHGVAPGRLRGLHGVTAADIIANLLPQDVREAAFARIREIEVADVEGITVLPGAAELLGSLEAGGVPTAIVTSSTDDLAEARLRATRLPRPPVVVTASDVERGKPWPDPWLEGARRLGVDPADCLVIEDSVAGLRAARAAGCRGLVAVLGTTSRAELDEVSDLVLEDVSHLSSVVQAGRVRVLRS